MAQGRDNARLFLKDNRELAEQLEAQLRGILDQERAKAAAELEARRNNNGEPAPAGADD